jgi:type I restriction enzyme M protein
MWERGVSSPSDEQMAELRKIFDQPVAQAAVAQVPASESDGAQPAAPRKSRKSPKPETNGNIGFENNLWAAADLLRSNMDAAEYKHVVLGLLFLKYVSDAFQERSETLADMVREPESEYHVEGSDQQEEEIRAILRDPDEFISANVFWVPEQARWSYLQAHAKQPEIGRMVDDAMDAIERENPALRGVLPKVFALPNLDKQSLGKLIDLISEIGLGTSEHRAKDTLGRVYEYFLSRFASSEGKNGGEFYTPTSIVRLLVEMIEPYEGRVYDPCCGSGGMFVQSLKFIEAHDGRRDKISVYGQESNLTTWRLAKMNLAIRGIEADLGKKHADSFREDLHPDLKADYILANPPFNVSVWHGETLQNDVRWKYGTPPAGNANYAWIQHFIHHMAPAGIAGFVMANGSMSSSTSGEGEIRKAIIEADLVDCMIAMPGQLFYGTQIPVCLWFLTRSKDRSTLRGFRDRRGETLFIDARKKGYLVDRVHRELSEDEIMEIGRTYHAWRGEKKDGTYQDIPGFCKSSNLDEIRSHHYVLTPGRYVGAEEIEDDGIPFEEKMAELAAKLREQMAEGRRLDAAILKNLEELGYGE